MSPDEFITKVNEHLKYIKSLYEEAYPDGNYITFTLLDGEWQYNNEYWNRDKDFPIEVSPEKGTSTPIE